MKKIIFFLLIIFSKPGYCLDLNSIKALLALSLCVEESNITEIHSSQINPGEWEQLVSVLERVVSGGGAVLEANSTRFHRLDFRVAWNNNRYRLDVFMRIGDTTVVISPIAVMVEGHHLETIVKRKWLEFFAAGVQMLLLFYSDKMLVSC